MGKGFDAYIKTRIFDAFAYLSDKLNLGKEMPFSELMQTAQDVFHMQGVSDKDFERNLLHLITNGTSYSVDIERKVLQKKNMNQTE